MSKILGKLNRKKFESTTDQQSAIIEEVIVLIAGADYLDLTPRQRVAQLVLFYDNEVCNGGHLQYFHNQGMTYAAELLRALEEIGARCEREIFAKASEYALANPVEPVSTLQEYHERAREREFEKLDRAYYKCRPSLGRDLLPEFIQKHLHEFIEFE